MAAPSGHAEYRQYAIEEYVLSEEPFYLPVSDEVELFTAAFHQKIPVLLKGPTGCGKTRFIEYMAYRLGRPARPSSATSPRPARSSPPRPAPGDGGLPRRPDGQRPGRAATSWRASPPAGSTGP